MLYVSIIFPPYFVFEKSGKIRKSQFKSQNKLGKNSYKISQYIGEKSQGKNKRTTSRVKLKKKSKVGCTDMQKESRIEPRNATKRKGRACCFPSCWTVLVSTLNKERPTTYIPEHTVHLYLRREYIIAKNSCVICSENISQTNVLEGTAGQLQRGRHCYTILLSGNAI
jgi:hypothetical protein